MNRDDAVKAAAEALRIESLNYANAAWATRWAAAAVDAAAPHLTADLVRERDEARHAADVSDSLTRTVIAAREHAEAVLLARAEKAEAKAARVEALCRESSVHGVAAKYPVVHVNAVLAALRGDQP